jgi:hypothetical protein
MLSYPSRTCPLWRHTSTQSVFSSLMTGCFALPCAQGAHSGRLAAHVCGLRLAAHARARRPLEQKCLLVGSFGAGLIVREAWRLCGADMSGASGGEWGRASESHIDLYLPGCCFIGCYIDSCALVPSFDSLLLHGSPQACCVSCICA